MQSDAYKILIIEDSTTVRMITAQQLESEGFICEMAENAEVGMQLLQQRLREGNPFHGLLLDWMLPGISGAMVMEELMNNPDFNSLAIMIFTERPDKRAYELASQRPNNDIQLKRDQDLLAYRLRKFLNLFSGDRSTPVESLLVDMDAQQQNHNRILLVDDSLTVLAKYQSLLEANGFKVKTATCMAEALEVAQNNPLDLAIIDYLMPNGNGDELTRALKQNPATRDLTVVIHSQRNDVLEQSLEAGAIDLIYKDDPVHVFLMRIRAILNVIGAQHQASQLKLFKLAANRLDIGLMQTVQGENRPVNEVMENFVSDCGIEAFAECTEENEELHLSCSDIAERIFHLVPLQLSDEEQITLVQEITRQKSAEKERQAMEVQLRHAHKLEAVGQLAAGIAHEINTPTQFVSDNTSFLQEAFEDYDRLYSVYDRLTDNAARGMVSQALVEEVKALAEEIDIDYLKQEIPKAVRQSLEGLARIARIVQAMKEFSHPGTLEKTPTDLNAAIETTINVSRNEWKYAAELITELDPELPQVQVLPGEFNQVILNLIVNAAHAVTDAVGTDGAMGEIRITSQQDGEWAKITVSDSGKGVPDDIQKRIFDPFFTTKEVGKGSGQGLAIAWSVIVDKHAGSIEVESEENEGSTFTIRLPLVASESHKGKKYEK